MDVVEKSWEVQKDVEERVRKIGKGKYGRVIKMARKPSHEEYMKVIQITGLGLLLIGGVGFLIYWLMTYLPTYFG
ncbi:MAG: preprotein translocase subunit SecE [Methanomassiliicoccales archaeon PtaU1.Bin030]|jgi:protein transport protein SEC61 subunit gamma and related proteins|nr:MAG: preprotein translocase subunit SecE [Methanomassiliicoccales archaeon PtaU1.Bin030]